jgi:hypothetical protein
MVVADRIAKASRRRTVAAFTSDRFPRPRHCERQQYRKEAEHRQPVGAAVDHQHGRRRAGQAALADAALCARNNRWTSARGRGGLKR